MAAGRYVLRVAERSDRTDPAKIPKEVRIAGALSTALGAVLLLNAGLALFYRDDLQKTAQEDVGSLLPPGQVKTVLIVASAVLLALGGLLVLVGVQIRRGRQWARVLAFVAAGIVILLSGVGALAGAGLLAVVLLGASVGIVALLMQSTVGEYFERDSSARPFPL